MALSAGDTTEWDDIQRKFGNFKPLEREIPQREVERIAVETLEQFNPLEHCNLKELHELEDDINEDTLARYRRERLAELKAQRSAAKFGSVYQVTKCDFVAQVTEASAQGQWVLVLLYVDACYTCHYMMKPWNEAARRFPAIKFLRGVASEVVPDFPDSRTPTVLVYRDKECQKNVVGLDEWGGKRCSVNCIEWVLAALGVVKTELEHDPRRENTSGWTRPSRCKKGQQSDNSDEESEEDDHKNRDDRCYTSSRLGHNMWKRI